MSYVRAAANFSLSVLVPGCFDDERRHTQFLFDLYAVQVLVGEVLDRLLELQDRKYCRAAGLMARTKQLSNPPDPEMRMDPRGVNEVRLTVAGS